MVHESETVNNYQVKDQTMWLDMVYQAEIKIKSQYKIADHYAIVRQSVLVL